MYSSSNLYSPFSILSSFAKKSLTTLAMLSLSVFSGRMKLLETTSTFADAALRAVEEPPAWLAISVNTAVRSTVSLVASL